VVDGSAALESIKKKLEAGASKIAYTLHSSSKIASEYYTHEELVQFKTARTGKQKKITKEEGRKTDRFGSRTTG